MALTVQTNTAAMSALKNLNINSNNMNKSLEKLASGFRVNTAADDASGFAVSSKLDAQTSRLKAASLNATQAQAMTKMADAGVNEIQNMLVRIQTLATQGASANNAGELGKLDAERIKLEGAIDKIANSTNYNGVNLLNGLNSSAVAGSVAQTTAGNGSVTSLTTTAANDGNVSANYSYTVAAAAGTAHVAATNSAVVDGGTMVATATGGNISSAAGSTFTITGDGAGGATVTNSAALFKADGTVALAAGAVTAMAAFNTATGMTVAVTTNGANNDTSTFSLATNGTQFVAAGAAGDTLTITGSNGDTGTATLTAGAAFSVTMSGAGAVLTGTAAATLANSTTTGVTAVTADVAAGAAYGAALAFQVGADNNADNQVTVDLRNSYKSADLGLTGDLLSQSNAQAYITTAKAALDTLVTQRADLGATQNQVAFIQANLATSIEQGTAAVSSIRDADMAAEMANFTKNNILTQASTSMLAQANQAAQNVLSLFR